ncbi:MAG: endolytic transglycosylase MltG [bacterium]|nr:endolytic transglycosylase MltG [bacterium]
MKLSFEKIVLVFILAAAIIFLVVPPNFYLQKTGLFTIPKGQSALEIGKNLEKQGFYKHSSIFFFLSLATGKANKLQAGGYLLEKNKSILRVLNDFSKGNVLKIKITFPEGITMKEIENKTNQEFEKWGREKINFSDLKIADFKKDFEFLKNVSLSANLEGFLFPDTYNFDLKTENFDIARIFLSNFEEKINKETKIKGEKNFFDILTMASLLEKEANKFEDKQKIADILWRRLEIKMPLQVDAAINYAIGKNKERLSLIDLEINSQYNTYKNLGLPPGPICNPGKESILAAVNPQKNDFWYYLSSSYDGKIIFSKDFEEHKLNKLKYLK